MRAILMMFICVFCLHYNVSAQEIVHDAEFYVLKAQHRDKWMAEDKELQAKLEALRKKHGTPPEHHPHHVG